MSAVREIKADLGSRTGLHRRAIIAAMRQAGDLPGIAHGRILEPEVMDDEDEVRAYEGGARTDHLDRLDDTFVSGALSKLNAAAPARRRLRALDVGCGTGSITVKLAGRLPTMAIVGVDRSAAMLRHARRLARDSRLADRVMFRRADGRRLPFADSTYDLVVSNSLMHHLPDPAPVLDEIARVLKPRGALFIRDLRRPAARLIGGHIKRHGRFYKGRMYQLFAASVRAAFTPAELRDIVLRSRLGGRRRRPPRVRRQFATYLVIEIP